MILSLDKKFKSTKNPFRKFQAIHTHKKKINFFSIIAFAASSKATLIIDVVDPSTS